MRRSRKWWGCLCLSACASLGLSAAGAPRVTRFVVYYGEEAPSSAFADYELVVLDGENHPPLQPLRKRGKTLLGYLSLGEVSQARSYFGELRSAGLLLMENPNWKGSFMIDLRSPHWTERVLDQLVPERLRSGFDGVFLDTVDNAAYLERLDPERFEGMIDAAVGLVHQIRLRHPTAPIMMNRGYELLGEVADHIDFVLGESVLSDYDFDTKSYRWVADGEYREQVNILRKARERRPEIQILTLDYWDPTDREGIRQIYQEQRANGFVPYVGTVELDRIVRER